MTLEALATQDPTVRAWLDRERDGWNGTLAGYWWMIENRDWLSLVALLVSEKLRLQKQVYCLAQQIAPTSKKENVRGESEGTEGEADPPEAVPHPGDRVEPQR